MSWNEELNYDETFAAGRDSSGLLLSMFSQTPKTFREGFVWFLTYAHGMSEDDVEPACGFNLERETANLVGTFDNVVKAEMIRMLDAAKRGIELTMPESKPDKEKTVFIKSKLSFDDNETESALIQKELRPDDSPRDWIRAKIVGIVLVLVFCLGSVLASGEDFNPNATAVWRGQTYTPASFPRGTWCGQNGACPMCESLRTQWRAWQPVSVVAPVQDDEWETKYRTEEVSETRYRKRKVCTPVYGPFGRQIGTNCHYVDEPYTVKVKKQVAYKVRKSPEPEPTIQVARSTTVETKLLPTPVSAIRRLLAHLKPTETDVIIDAGSGDGRFLIEASTFGSRAIGVEIDSKNVLLSRRLIREAKSSAIVFEGDALAFDYGPGSIIYIYQYPDLIERIVKRIPKGRRVVSYMHPIPGVQSVEFRDGDSVFYIGTVGGESNPEKSFTFGL